MSVRDNGPAKKGDYVVPLPRATDGLGQTLRRVFAGSDESAPFADLLRRLDTLH